MVIGFIVGLLVTAFIAQAMGVEGITVLLGGLCGLMIQRMMQLQNRLDQQAGQLRGLESVQRMVQPSVPAPPLQRAASSLQPQALNDAVSIPASVELQTANRAVFSAAEPTPVPPSIKPAADAPLFARDAPTAAAQQAAEIYRADAAPEAFEPLASSAARAAPTAMGPPALPFRARELEAPSPIAQWLQSILSMENWPIKLGVLLLLIGLASGFRYLVAEGYLNVSIEIKMLGVAALALAALAFGWRQRTSRPSFGLALQGGALGALLLTIYASLQLYTLISGGAAFTMMLIVVAAGVTLALLQDAIWLALFAALGGFMAPILASTGSGSHVQLFTYYLVLNLGILSIALSKGWRALNLLGAIATFSIGLTWGARLYQPAYLSSVEPFVIAFFLIYLAITVLYVLNHGEGEPVQDGILVFGVPLATLAAQASLLHADRKSLGLFCVLTAVVYAALRLYLKSRDRAPILQQSFLILAMSFATLAVPLYFNAGWTSALWALEGAAVLWLGTKQNRILPQWVGIGLQLVAALAYFNGYSRPIGPSAFFNAHYAGAMLIALSGFCCSFLLDRARQAPLAGLMLAWASGWWILGNATEIDRHTPVQFQLAMLITLASVTMMASAAVKNWLTWDRLRWLALVALGLAPLLVWSAANLGDPIASARGLAFAGFGVAALFALNTLRQPEDEPAHPLLMLLHGVLLLSMMALIALSFNFRLPIGAGEGCRYAVLMLPALILTWLCTRGTNWLAWPLQKDFPQWRESLLAVLLAVVVPGAFIACFSMGSPAPLRFIPVFNPLELTQALTLLLLWQYRAALLAQPENQQRAEFITKVFLALAFVTISAMALRLSSMLFSPASTMLQAFISQSGQATLAIVWSLLGCGAMLIGHARHRRPLWIAGACLMGVVLAKLLLVDRQHLGDLPGIFAMLGVGLLLAGVGYFAPAPPAEKPLS